MELNSYQKERLDRLEKFERTVRRVTEGLGIAIIWVWVIVTIGSVALVYYKPVEANGTLQGILLGVLLSNPFITALVNPFASISFSPLMVIPPGVVTLSISTSG